jgi:sporulation protein YqfC
MTTNKNDVTNKNELNKRKNKDLTGANFREKLIELLELPKELVFNLPKITIMGRNNLIIENYTGIFEYESDHIRANTGAGIIKITGNSLLIKEITHEDIMVSGEIEIIEFIK